ncbi:MAG: 50S ribosomal protein L11 methyltransferase [Alphaproteobacteria bacterium]|nr:50S ribosomal protein L11 methyltransferase [Alphaproteobacteria bacterium]
MKQVRLYITASEADCARALDILSARFEDDGYPIATQEIDEDRDVWEASLYASADEKEATWKAMSECLAAALPGCGVRIEDLPDIDWVTYSLEGLQPVRAGRFLVHGSHDRDQVRPNDLAIEIDAGRAFGTGHHGTTAGCLEMIEQVMRHRPFGATLDLGTGSAVLAIAIAKLAHRPVLATDIDPVAVEVARDNTRKNGCASLITLRTARGFHADVFARKGPFDLIVANILARPLMAMAPDIRRHLAHGGNVILSGILASQRRKVLAAFAAQGIHHRRTLWRDGWVTLHCVGANEKRRP